jgi:hypothetical protein
MFAPTHPMQLALGLIVWAAWFVALYGGLSVGCAVAPPAAELGSLNWLNLLLGAFTLIVVAWLIRQMVLCWQGAKLKGADGPRQRFVPTVSAGIYAVAAVSTLFMGLPVIGLPPCL